MTFENIRQLLAQLHQSRDSILYAQFLDWLEAMYDEAKEKVLRAQPDEREVLVGEARSYQKIIADLSQQMH